MGILFRPSFCANCGDKIERDDWGLFTSRRFCQVCESEFKGLDLVPKVIVAAGLLLSVFGFGSYLKSGPAAPESQTLRQAKRFVEQPAAPAKDALITQTANKNVAPPTETQTQFALPISPAATPQISKSQPPQFVVAEQTYICGAETKKGTPCSRRVKGNVRCFQHTGMPPMLTPDKLKIQ